MRRMLKISSGTTDGWVGFLKCPTPGSQRASFSIVRRKQVDGKTVNETVKHEALDVINAQFKAGVLQFEQARNLAKDLLDQINNKKAVNFGPHNEALLNEYWEQIVAHKHIVDKRSAYNRLYRGVAAVGHYSLISASREELQREIDGKFKGNKQRTIIATVNQLLRFWKRDFRLQQAPEEFNEVRYLTETELPKLLSFIEDPKLKLMHEVAFATGLRAGELFGLLPNDIRKKHELYIRTQIDVNGVRRRTKNRKERRVYILRGYYDQVVAWAQIPLEERLTFRKRSIAKLTRVVSKKALGRELVFHDLRHSYVIHLISIVGENLTRVAQYIGDSIQTAEKAYSGFVATPESIEATARLDTPR
jgi:integrase